MKRIAVKRLHLGDGTVLTNKVIEFQYDGPACRIMDLNAELPNTVWIGSDYYLNAGKDKYQVLGSCVVHE